MCGVLLALPLPRGMEALLSASKRTRPRTVLAVEAARDLEQLAEELEREASRLAPDDPDREGIDRLRNLCLRKAAALRALPPGSRVWSR